MRPEVLTLLLAVTLAPALSGCGDDGPLAGVGTAVSDSLRAILPEDLADSLLGPAAVAGNPELDRLRIKAMARKAAAKAAKEAARPATEAIDDRAVEQQTRKNMLFDHYRTEGIEALEAGRTADGIASFKKALLIKPGDTNALMWLDIAEHPENHPAEVPVAEGNPLEGIPAGIPGGIPGGFPQAVPVLPAGAGRAMPQGNGAPPPLPMPPG
ncbi:MAG: hypothetical protein VKP57_13225 [Candidatus Sericytochromatia bacterium]|nr:hypothetical protein [Candidatus Sericytochromatia bacterium]